MQTNPLERKSFGVKTIIVIPKEQFDHGGTRNTAAEKAEVDILVYLTQDAMPADERSLEYLLKYYTQRHK